MLLAFDFKFMFQLVNKALFHSRDTHARITPKRFFIILIHFPLFLILETFNWLGFLLDELLFSSYRKVEVKDPIFVVGVPRSGTTFMHRLLAEDRNVTSLKLWEILFAPSICQKKFWLGVAAIDRLLGRRLYNAIIALEKRRFAELAKMHKLSIFMPEEDEPILIHIFSSLFLPFMFPYKEEFDPLVHFDQDLPAKQRAHIMSFYKRCVQKHLFVFGKEKRFLSKNPAFSPKINSLYKTFPTARIVCLVRTPLEAVPSSISMLDYFAKLFNSPLNEHPMREQALEMTDHFYRYPLEELPKYDPKQQAVLLYKSLVSDPEKTVLDLYQRFGFLVSPEYQETLVREKEKAGKYRSTHSYSLAQYDLTHRQIVDDYRFIFEQFGFSDQEAEAETG